MKKLFAILMTVAMMLSVIASLAITSSAAVTMVEPTYAYDDTGDEFGAMPAEFCDGLWRYEYRMAGSDEWEMMGEYVESHASDDVLSQYKCYTPYENARKDGSDPAFYCIIRAGGRQMHPSGGADAVITFVVPASGVISYTLSIYMDGNSIEGDNLGVYRNDDLVWPTNGKMFNLVPNEDTTATEVSIDSLSVKAGDCIRFVVNGRGSTDSKGTTLSKRPVVTYLEADVPIHAFFPPENVSAEASSDSCVVSWTPAQNAVSYNVYLKDEKQNTEPIVAEAGADTVTFTLTGLEAGKSYLGLSVASVNEQGEESEKSVGIGFRTKKASDVPATTDATDSGKVTDTNQTDASTATSATPSSGSNVGLIIGIIAAAVALAAIVVVVVLILKKKKAPEATEAPSDDNQ